MPVSGDETVNVVTQAARDELQQTGEAVDPSKCPSEFDYGIAAQELTSV
jgi:hypothetical protein